LTFKTTEDTIKNNKAQRPKKAETSQTHWRFLPKCPSLIKKRRSYSQKNLTKYIYWRTIFWKTPWYQSINVNVSLQHPLDGFTIYLVQ